MFDTKTLCKLYILEALKLLIQTGLVLMALSLTACGQGGGESPQPEAAPALQGLMGKCEMEGPNLRCLNKTEPRIGAPEGCTNVAQPGPSNWMFFKEAVVVSAQGFYCGPMHGYPNCLYILHEPNGDEFREEFTCY